MAATIKDWVEAEEKIDAPYEARWQAWYAALSPEQRAEYHTGASLGADPLPPEPARSYRVALRQQIMAEARHLARLPFVNLGASDADDA